MIFEIRLFAASVLFCFSLFFFHQLFEDENILEDLLKFDNDWSISVTTPREHWMCTKYDLKWL